MTQLKDTMASYPDLPELMPASKEGLGRFQPTHSVAAPGMKPLILFVPRRGTAPGRGPFSSWAGGMLLPPLLCRRKDCSTDPVASFCLLEEIARWFERCTPDSILTAVLAGWLAITACGGEHLSGGQEGASGDRSGPLAAPPPTPLLRSFNGRTSQWNGGEKWTIQIKQPSRTAASPPSSRSAIASFT